MAQARVFQAILREIRSETPSVKSFRFEIPEEGFTFRPGQWMDLFVTTDGKEWVGGYSMISSPHWKHRVDLAIKQAFQHPVTRYMHEKARVGEVFRLTEGQGSLRYVPEGENPVTLLAGGIGITPLLSILRTELENPASHRPLHLIYSIRNSVEFAFREELERFAAEHPRFRMSLNYSREGEEGVPEGGRRISREWLEKEAQIDPGSHFYLCGPPAMIDLIADTILPACRVSASHIHYERWW